MFQYHTRNEHLVLIIVHTGIQEFAPQANKQRNEANDEVHDRSNIRSPDRSIFRFGRHNALKYVLLWYRSQSDRYPGTNIKTDTSPVTLRQKIKKALRLSINYRHEATSLLVHLPAQCKQADDNHNRLKKVGNRHCPHSPDVGIHHHDESTECNPIGQFDACQRFEHVGHGYQLRCDPAKIRRHHTHCRDKLRAMGEPASKKIIECQHIEPVQWSCKEPAHQKQAERSTERILDDCQQAPLNKFAGRTHDCFGTEPGSKEC